MYIVRTAIYPLHIIYFSFGEKRIYFTHSHIHSLSFSLLWFEYNFFVTFGCFSFRSCRLRFIYSKWRVNGPLGMSLENCAKVRKNVSWCLKMKTAHTSAFLIINNGLKLSHDSRCSNEFFCSSTVASLTYIFSFSLLDYNFMTTKNNKNVESSWNTVNESKRGLQPSREQKVYIWFCFFLFVKFLFFCLFICMEQTNGTNWDEIRELCEYWKAFHALLFSALLSSLFLDSCKIMCIHSFTIYPICNMEKSSSQ